MAVNVTIAGTTYAFPTEGEDNWGPVVTQWAIAVSSQLLQKTGGAFTLTADADFGATFATVQAYLKSRSSNIATTGFVRLARTDTLSFRNQANSANLPLGVDSSNNLTFNGHVIIPSTGVIQPTEGGTGISSYTTGDTLYASASNVLSKLGIGTANKVYTSDGSIPAWALLVNANIDPSAAIAYSKLNLSGSIVNADVNSAAAIAYSKLNLSGSIVNADVNAAAAIAYSKLALTGSILNADINASAAIARSKIASGTNYRILANSSSGVMSENAALTQHRQVVVDANGQLANNAALTAGHVIYADVNGELAGEATLATSRGGTNLATYTTGDLIYCSASSVLSKLGIGSSGQVLKVSGGVPTWGASAGLLAVSAKSSGFTLDTAVDVYECDATSGAFNATVPAAGTNTGKTWYLIKTDSSTNAVSLITGLTSSLNTQNEVIQIYDDGTSIKILNRRIPSAWTSFTPTGLGTTGATYTGQWRRVGDSVELQLKCVATTAASVTGGSYYFVVPSFAPVDTSKVLVDSAGVAKIGIGHGRFGSTNYQLHGVFDGTNIALWTAKITATYLEELGAISRSANTPVAWSNGDNFLVTVRYPVTGWNG